MYNELCITHREENLETESGFWRLSISCQQPLFLPAGVIVLPTEEV